MLLALCPDLVLSTGFLPLSTPITEDLATSLTWLQVTNGLVNETTRPYELRKEDTRPRYPRRRCRIAVAPFVVEVRDRR